MTVENDTPEPSIEEFVTGLMTPEGEINEDAVSKLDEGQDEKKEVPENGKEADPDTSAPERDEQGRFKSKDTEEGAAKDKEASDAKDKDTEPEKGKEPDKGKEEKADKEGEGEAEEPVKPPATMSAKDREAFYKLPPDQQKWLVESEKHMQSGASRQIAEYAERMKAVEPLERVLAPHKEKFAHMGATPEQVVDRLLALADHADRDFVGFTKEQARLRGIPLEAFGVQQQSGEDGEGRSYAPDPKVEALEQKVAQLTEFIQSQQQQQQTQTLSTMQQAVEKVAGDTEKYPFYGELEPAMVPIVAGLRSADPSASPEDILDTAYHVAANRNPEVRAKIDADARARDNAERERAQREAAAKARRSASGEYAGNGALPSGGEDLPDNMDDFVLQEANRLLRA